MRNAALEEYTGYALTDLVGYGAPSPFGGPNGVPPEVLTVENPIPRNINHGQLELVCESCDGQRIISSDDTPAEVCDWCDGSGIDPMATPVPLATLIDKAANLIANAVVAQRSHSDLEKEARS